MRFEVDIQKRLADGARSFFLESRFSARDETIALFGPSGSGKSLTLRAVAGLMRPDKGRIVVDGVTLFDSEKGIDLPARSRRVGFMFQDYALFPHLTVRENVAFGLKKMLQPLAAEARRRVGELLEIFGLSETAGAYPREISGGQRQRAGLARTLACEPRILLLDEPFSALDQPLRLLMRQELAQALERFRIPAALVTHDPEDVEALAGSVAVYNHGRVESVCTSGQARRMGANLAGFAKDRVAAAYAAEGACGGLKEKGCLRPQAA